MDIPPAASDRRSLLSEAAQREVELDRHGMLGPERAVVVEDRDALCRGMKSGCPPG